MKILLTGGGTGGHSIPLIVVYRALLRLNPQNEFLWLGSKQGPEKKQAQKENIPFRPILTGKLRRYFSFKNFFDPFKIILGGIQSFFILKRFKPDVIFSKGGYVSFPVVLVGWFLKVPIFLHESDAIPGLTNRILARFAKKIFLGFKEAEVFFKEGKILFTGNPVREGIQKGDRQRAYQFFRLTPNLPVVLIIGGSQGAQQINELTIRRLARLLEEVQIIHLCGGKNLSFCRETTEPLFRTRSYKERYYLSSYLDEKEMADAYSIANLIVSRAGANTLAEIALLGKASILIPFPFAARNHQLANAKVFQRKGASILLIETSSSKVSSEEFVETILELIKDQKKIRFMEKAVKELSCPQAGKIIARELGRNLKF